MRTPLRIGIEVQRLFRVKKHGMEVVALEILKELQELDTFNQYFIFVKDDEDSACFTETKNFKIVLVQGRTYFDWEQIYLPKAVDNFELDFLHSTCNTSALYLSVPLILTLHDIIYLEKLDFKGTAYQNFGNIYRKLIVPKLVKNSKIVITVSHFEKDVISKKLKSSVGKLEVIYNGVNKKFNPNYSLPLINKFKNNLLLPKDFILFLGNTAPKKNTPNLIEAYAIYCESADKIVPLVILDFDRSLVVEILEKLGKAAVIEHIVFPGFISSDQMPLIYNAAMVFVYPSIRESFGLPILEAMASNTPVITSNTSCMPEIAGDAALFINPAEPKNIAKAIETLVEDSALRENLCAKGLARALSFNWKSSAQQLLKLYKQVT